MTAKLRRVRAQLPYLPRALALAWMAARRWTIAWIILLIAQGLLPVATVYLTKAVVDRLVSVLRPGASPGELGATLLLVALMAAVLLLAEVLRSITAWIRTAQSQLVQDHISGLIHEKSVAIDLAFYDSPDYYDHLHRARTEASYRPVALLETLGSLLQNGITLVAMLAVLVRFGFWLPVALAASTLPALYVALRYTMRQYDWRLRNTPRERRTWYYDWVLTSGETAPELRLFALGDHFRSLFQTLRRKVREERVELARSQSMAELAAGALALLITGAGLAWMVWRAVRGLATLGDVALFYQAFHQGLRLTRSLLEGVGQLYANILFLSDLFEFLALEPRITAPPSPAAAPARLKQGIRFQQVTFRYPGSERPALRDFSLSIPAGQIAAIVGPNGAGKSTLMKLLCRFYDPDSGRIELDGIDLRALAPEQLRRMITVLFQQPVHYNATAAENIGLGDLHAGDGNARLEAAACAAGADEIIARLPQGFDNLLGRWFEGGVELSVGEWQRIALARAFLRPAPILILDEPTSAMDPWAEADWLERFRRICAGRTGIIITHRFTTAMHADVIHVIAEGRIAESGPHEDLLARGGSYAQWRTAQLNINR